MLFVSILSLKKKNSHLKFKKQKNQLLVSFESVFTKVASFGSNAPVRIT